MTKDANFKFGVHAPRDSPDMTPEKFFRKGAWPGSCDPIEFWALNANSSKMTKVTNFKFGIFAPRESPIMTLNIFEKGAWPGPRDRLNFVGVKC